MEPKLSIIRGIHPGFILDRELKKRKLPKKYFAVSVNEFPQTLVAITKGKRRLTPALSLKLDNAFGFEEGYFMILQAYYDIEQEKKKLSKTFHPDFSKIRSAVFWDTDFDRIDWQKHKPGIIKRIFERGNEQEIKEIIRFYGKKDAVFFIKQEKNLLPTAENNIKKYL